MARKAGGLLETETLFLESTHTHARCSKSQHKDSSLKSTCVIGERDPLTKFRTCAGGVEIWWNFLQGQKHWQVPLKKKKKTTLLLPSGPNPGVYHFCTLHQLN